VSKQGWGPRSASGFQGLSEHPSPAASANAGNRQFSNGMLVSRVEAPRWTTRPVLRAQASGLRPKGIKKRSSRVGSAPPRLSPPPHPLLPWGHQPPFVFSPQWQSPMLAVEPQAIHPEIGVST